MNAIRSQLLITILPTLAVVWLLCSGALYFNTRHFLYESLDQELNLLASNIPLIVSSSQERFHRRISERERLFGEGGHYFFEVWQQDGTSRNRSKSLGERHIPFHGNFTRERIFSSEKLTDGTSLRTVRFQLTPPRSKNKPKRTEKRPRRRLNIFVGKDQSEVEATLKKLRETILLSTLLGLTVAGFAVFWSVRRGLKPLAILGDQLSKIGSKNLDERLDSKRNPQELQIVSDKVNGLLARLEDAFDRERRFGSDLAHEIRTPTAEIRALAEMGLTWPEEFGSEELESILQSSQRMETTTQAILDLTRIDTSSELDHEEIELNPLVSSLLPDTRSFNLTGEVTLESNRAFLTIILQNLINNAAAYAPENDPIDIRLEKNFFEIENTAPELNEIDLPRMTERFWRKDQARTSTHHVGLGLRLASACADKLGYTLTPDLKSQRLRMTLSFSEDLS